MEKETMGTVISVVKQGWLKVNTKPVRMHALDGAAFPHVIKIRYTVDGRDYVKRKWVRAGLPVPVVGSAVKILYRADKPAKATVL